MIISLNPEPHREEFDLLLKETIHQLNSNARINPEELLKLAGTKFEQYVSNIMCLKAENTPFHNTIECVGGQKFPDIIAKKYYGVEVKTTTQNHWRTTGNSVLESTRSKDVERIFMLFGKLTSKKIEFKHRLYEECLSAVVVTHSPRYLIDMDLEHGNTIFDKLKIPYDTVRKHKNPIGLFVDYYKQSGEDAWWIDQPSSLIIRLWKNIPSKEKIEIMQNAMVLFPEIFGNSNGNKFNQFAVWLVKNKSIVNPNSRDIFTAGGTHNIKLISKTFKNTPRIIHNLVENIDSIFKILKKTPSHELSKYWNQQTSEKNKVDQWINLVASHSAKLKGAEKLPMKTILYSLQK